MRAPGTCIDRWHSSTSNRRDFPASAKRRSAPSPRSAWPPPSWSTRSARPRWASPCSTSASISIRAGCAPFESARSRSRPAASSPLRESSRSAWLRCRRIRTAPCSCPTSRRLTGSRGRRSGPSGYRNSWRSPSTTRTAAISSAATWTGASPHRPTVFWSRPGISSGSGSTAFRAGRHRYPDRLPPAARRHRRHRPAPGPGPRDTPVTYPRRWH